MNIENISWEAELDLETVGKSLNDSIKTKKLFRYQFKDSPSDVNILEKAISTYVDSKFALGVSSATNAIFLALKSVGVQPNSKVLIPSFTFTAVPSAVIQCGAEPVLVDITEDFVIDLRDLERKIDSSGSGFLLLSHMRGHLCDMDEVVRICKKHSIKLVEDSAHALGVTWNGKHAGTFGLAGIYSLQSYKVINAGEGGILVTDNPEIFWQSVFMSGSYETNYKLHSKSNLEIAERFKNKLPVFNVRMSNITASIAIPQVFNIESTIDSLQEKYNFLNDLLSSRKEISLTNDPIEVRPVRDSAQIRIRIDEESRTKLKTDLNIAGIPISYFGGTNNTNARLYDNWQFIDNINNVDLPNTKKHLAEVFDLRLPIHLNLDEIKFIGNTFLDVFDNINL